jgi:hypothetical protein
MLNFIYLILGLCVLGALVMIVYAYLKPTDNTCVVPDERTALKLEAIDHDKAVFSFLVPMRNTSDQIAAVTDAFVRPYLPQEQFPDAVCWGRLELETARRDDNYFEAVIMNPNDERNLVVTLVLQARNGKDIREVLRHMVDMDVCIYITGVGRKEHYVRRAYITVYGADMANLAGGNYNG